jgi:hypothetical protein
LAKPDIIILGRQSHRPSLLLIHDLSGEISK